MTAQPEIATNRPHATPPESVAGSLNELLKGLVGSLKEPPELSIATAYFNVAGYAQLADCLDAVGPVRILLGAEPDDSSVRTTLTSLASRDSSEANPELRRALERHDRAMFEDRDLLGFTREADAEARRLVTWLRTHPVDVRRLADDFLHGKAYLVTSGQPSAIVGSSNMTYAGLMRNRELNLGAYQPSTVAQVRQWFDEQWNDAEPYDLAALYESRWLPHRPWDVFLRMLHELYGADLAPAQEPGDGLQLTQFQRDGVWRARRILAKRRGVIVADEVGLGKTYIAGELIHRAAFVNRQRVLIVAPATLRDSTWTPFLDRFKIFAQVVSYEELVRDIERAGKSDSELHHPDDYAMVVVDEAHNLRNADTQRAEAMRTLLGGAVPKDLVLLTATPVNNGLEDLKTLISYITPSDAAFVDIDIPSVDKYFGRAMALDPDELTGQHLFELLDAVAVRRTRRFIQTQYPNTPIVIDGEQTTVTFPEPKVIRVDYRLDELLPGFFDRLAVALGADVEDQQATETGVILGREGSVLSMARYVPSRFKRGAAIEQYQVQNAGLLRSALLKRFESSAVAFAATLTKMIASHDQFLGALDQGYVLEGDALRAWAATDSDDITAVVDAADPDHVTPASSFDVERLRTAVHADRALLDSLRRDIGRADHTTDPKIVALIEEIHTIARGAKHDAVSEADRRNKRKVLVFTYFSDTAEYIYDALRQRANTDPALADFAGRIVLATGSDQAQRREAIVGFAPETAGRPGDEDRYDIAVATDVLSEGVNLQQARHIVNYDLPWNPMRLVQRYGRVDRIGSKHRRIFLRCFFPDQDLEALLNLEQRLQRKLKQAAAAFGTGEVLPGIQAVDRVLAETRAEIERFAREDAGALEDSQSASASSEEFQRRLARAFESDILKRRVIELPWGAGAGFVRAGAKPAVVFCARIADHPRPQFRYVEFEPDTLTIARLDNRPFVSRELLACLNAADPGQESTPSDLPDALREALFDAWTVAQRDIYDQWMVLTDPANLESPVPAVMRWAADLVREHGSVLGNAQDSLVQRFNQAVENRILRAIREIRRQNLDEATTVRMLATAADDLRLPVPQPVRPYPVIELDDVRPICWMAVHSG